MNHPHFHAAPEALGDTLARYEIYMRIEDAQPLRLQREYLDTVGEFLGWLERDGAGSPPPAADFFLDCEAAWECRERFLIAHCTDRSLRHDLRLRVNDFLRFMQETACL